VSLPVLVVVVAIGIAMVVLAVHLTGGSVPAEFGDADQAAKRFAVDFPEAEVRRAFVSRDRRDVVLELADGHVGLVHAIGKMALTRFVAAGEMAAHVSGDDPRKVDLDTGDFTWPRAHFEFEDRETASEVAGLFADRTAETKRQAA
jgi:ferric-dicitrate binding protein FerR (iron transport regulator)